MDLQIALDDHPKCNGSGRSGARPLYKDTNPLSGGDDLEVHRERHVAETPMDGTTPLPLEGPRWLYPVRNCRRSM
jgi:hypothetical protein